MVTRISGVTSKLCCSHHKPYDTEQESSKSFACFFFVTQQSLALVLLSTYPLIAKLSGLALTLALNCASVAKNVLAVSL